MGYGLESLIEYEKKIRDIKELIITNLLLIGQTPAPTFKEEARTKIFLERLTEFQIDECATDGYRNSIGIIRGRSRTRPPIFMIAHMDTPFDTTVDHNFSVNGKTITGAGLLDNSLGVAVLASLPEILRRLDVVFESDIVLAGVIQSLGRGNLRGIRYLSKTWLTPIRGAILIEGGELGRLNYYSDGMIRGEIYCKVFPITEREMHIKTNAILVLNEIVNQILSLRIPQRPRSNIVIGKISGGHRHGLPAIEASLGFEIRSDSDFMVHELYSQIKDVVDGIRHEYEIELQLKTISNVNASRLAFNHPLVKNASQIMESLNLSPLSDPSESELSILLSNRIPSVALGITHGERYHGEKSIMSINPMFKGVSQIVGVMLAIDSGVCDERPMD